MLRTATVLVCVMMVSTAFCAETLTIDDFEYGDVQAARQAWGGAEECDPAELMARQGDVEGKALKMPCPFTREDVDRAVYDLDIELDLTQYGTISFDFYADNMDPISHGTIYFRTEHGWYGQGFHPSEGWKHIQLSRGSFGTEGEPDGWDKITGVRICAWKARPVETFCAVDNLIARLEDIVVIRGTPEGREAKGARKVAERISRYLRDMGLPHGSVTDEDAAAGALKGRKMAIFGYSPGMEEEVVKSIKEFVANGGRIIVCYTAPESVRELLGVKDYSFQKREYGGQFAEIALQQKALEGLPESIAQNSWNIHIAKTGGQNARIIGRWRDGDGQTGPPAIVLSDNGAYIGHILTGAGGRDKARLMLALLGHFVPDAWKLAAEHELTGAERIGPFANRADLKAYLKQKTADIEDDRQIRQKLKAAQRVRKQAQQAMQQKQYVAVMDHAAKLNSLLSSAYMLAHESRKGEFRAVWNHSGTGDCGDWETAMQHLAEGNFNAVVPNMWWGGVAHYDSEYLPHSETFKNEGDQIAQCVVAGKKYGIEVHPWKVNWNLGGRAPEEFVEKMRKQGRLQKSVNGDEIRWLCPSHPKNFQLELNAMLEVVRKYDVDGVHFDYIRYPHGNACYCDGCQKRFEEHIGREIENWPEACHSGEFKDEYRDWRCEQITRLVRETSERAHKIKPHIKISAAVFRNYPRCRETNGQDWVKWCREGWLDFVCPMDYTTDDDTFRRTVETQIGHVGGTVPLYTGIGHFRIPDDQAVGQIQISRSLGSDGFILFNMGRSLAESGMPKFAKGVTSEPAVLPHNAPEIEFQTKLDDHQPIVKITDEKLEIKVTIHSLGEHRKEASGADGYIVVQDMAGEGRTMLGQLPEAGATRTYSLLPLEGRFRLAARGQLEFADGSTRFFIRRSRPYRFVRRGAAETP